MASDTSISSSAALADSPVRGERSSLRAYLSALGPLSSLAVLVGALLSAFTVFRLAFVCAYLGRLRDVPGYLAIFPIGLRVDAITIAYVSALPVLCLLLLPPAAVKRVRWALCAYAAGVVAVALFLELGSIGFLDEYDSRPNRLFLEYLQQSHEVTKTIWAQYPLLLIATALVVGAAGWLVWRASERLLVEHRPWSARRRLLVLPGMLALIAIGARGSLGARLAGRSFATFSNSHLANELGPNSLYTIANAFLDLHLERSPEELYGKMARDEIVERVRRWSNLPDSAGSEAVIPLLHTQGPAADPPTRSNLVIVLEESLGAQFVGSLGGLPLTPNLEALGQEGLWFTNLYATGTRTVRGLEATVCGFLPTPSSSVVKLGLSQENFFTMAALLKRHGYATEYLYGGEGQFDNMRNFLQSNGFDHAVDQRDFEHPTFVATWGVSDEDLMQKANEVFVGHGQQPFFALILSTSNHAPFEFPDGRIELYDQEQATRNNSVKYADYAIGELFRLARQEEYFQRTIWLIVADHDTRAPSDDLIPVDHFHIPGLILGPGVEPRVFTPVASQIDLMPTALHLLGLAAEHPMPGRDLLSLPPSDPGRAILQYYNVHGFLAGERLVVHQPFAEPLEFRYRDGQLEPEPTDPELEKDALAHVLLPWMLYQEQRYRLP